MGKGDKKTRRGKIHRGTFGVRRPRGKKSAVATVSKAKPKAKPKTTTKSKAAAKPKAKKEEGAE